MIAVIRALKWLFDKPQPIQNVSSEPLVRYISITPDGLELIKHFESCLKRRPDGYIEAYADPGYGWSVPTIGWGTVRYENGQKVKKGDVISQTRADELLAWEVHEKATGVSRLFHVELAPHELAALTSFAYNVGLGALAKSTLRKRINARDPQASEEFLKWNKSNGKVLSGLPRRRNAERAMFDGGDWQQHVK